MEAERYIEHVVRLAAAAEQLPDDAEDRVAAMGLEPTLRDRTLLLIEQTRTLVERAAHQADTSDDLRAAADQAGSDTRDDRQAMSDARESGLTRRESTADARDDTLAAREGTAETREHRLDHREQSAELDRERLERRDHVADVRAEALDLREQRHDAHRAEMLDEVAAERLVRLVAAMERGWRAAQQTADPVEQPTKFEDAVFDAVPAELQQVVPQMVQEAMDRWVNHAYHELRQPLAVITGAIETLRAYYERLDEETRSLLLARMRRQTMLLQRVIDQLEQASRLQKGPPEVTPQLIDLRPVIDQLLEDYGPLLDGASVTYERPDDVVAACVEPPAATEILLVLLRNAVDHAPCDQPIMIETIPGTTTVRVSVHDDGAGVPLANRDRIFAYGTRLDDGGRLGLGLFIARGLARDHGGDLTVTQSQLLGGARFDLTLPTDCGQDVELPQ